jgi:hypothetical protein
VLVVRLIFDVSVRGRKHLEISGWVETEPGYQVGVGELRMCWRIEEQVKR